MQKNASLLAIVAVRTAENEPPKGPKNTHSPKVPGGDLLVEGAGEPPGPRGLADPEARQRPRVTEYTQKITANFEKLVLGCMDSYDSERRHIFDDFSAFIEIYKICIPFRAFFQLGFPNLCTSPTCKNH